MVEGATHASPCRGLVARLIATLALTVARLRLTLGTQLRQLRTLRLGEQTPHCGVEPRRLDRHVNLRLGEILRQRGDLCLVGRHALDGGALRLACGSEFLDGGLYVAAMLLANLLELRSLRLGEIQ